MNPFSVLIGLFVALIGVIFLGINVGFWSSAVWGYLATLWPIILIVVGLRFIIRNNALFLGLTLLVLLAAGFAVTNPKVRSYNTVWRWTPEKEANVHKSLSVEGATDLKLILPGRFDIELQGGDTNEVTVNFNGAQSVLDAVKLEKKENRIELSVNRDMFNFWSFDEVEGTITLPRSLNLNLDISGVSEVDIRNNESKVTLSSSGASQVTFHSSVAIDPTVEVSGAGEIIFDVCRGSGRIESSGAAQIEAKRCELTDLAIDSSGGGDVVIREGSIGNLDVDISGATSVKVPRPTGQIREDKSGVGKVEFFN